MEYSVLILLLPQLVKYNCWFLIWLCCIFKFETIYQSKLFALVIKIILLIILTELINGLNAI